jgi:uncharacterized MAPEG superfamily protein
MTPELTVLVLAALLQMAQIVLYSVLANRQVDLDYALGPRDAPRQLPGMAGRAQRAMNNHFEGLILFAIAALALHATGQSSSLTAVCAAVYLAARLLYVPAYLLALAPWRSVVWAVGWFATAIMLVAALI